MFTLTPAQMVRAAGRAGEGEREGVGEGVVPGAGGEAEGVRVGVGVARREGEAEGARDFVGVVEAEAPRESEAVGLGDAVREGVPESETVRLGDAVREGVGLGDAVHEGVPEKDSAVHAEAGSTARPRARSAASTSAAKPGEAASAAAAASATDEAPLRDAITTSGAVLEKGSLSSVRRSGAAGAGRSCCSASPLSEQAGQVAAKARASTERSSALAAPTVRPCRLMVSGTVTWGAWLAGTGMHASFAGSLQPAPAQTSSSSPAAPPGNTNAEMAAMDSAGLPTCSTMLYMRPPPPGIVIAMQ